MKVIDPGHRYELDNLASTDSLARAPQVLDFVKKEPVEVGGDGGAEGELKTVVEGTTNEEVLRMLIDRMQYLQGKAPCRENAIVITKLEESLMWLEKRTADRKARNVEGTNLK